MLTPHTRLLSLVLGLGLIATTAVACETGTTPTIEVVAEPTPVVVASHLTLSDIAELARHAGQTSDQNPMGFYTSQVTNEVHVEPGAGPNALCAAAMRIIVNIRLADRRIEVAREVLEQPCRYDAVLRHYERKADADRKVFDDYVMTVAIALRGAQMPPLQMDIDETALVAARQSLETWVKAIVTPNLQLLHTARVTAFHALDSVDEVQRISHACAQHT
jgi:hypothetical protein